MKAWQVDCLCHYGVKGMKWGVRRSRDKLKYNSGSISSVLKKRLPSVQTPNGVTARKISMHALQQIERRDDRKVTAHEIVDALESPLHIIDRGVDSRGRSSIQYIGKRATVALNPDTGVISAVWKTGARAQKKYQKGG